MILVTGAAGFIGYHVSKRLLAEGHKVVGADNLNDYYDVRLKETRLAQLTSNPAFSFVKLNIADRGAVERLFAEYGFTHIVHLAAQAGVRYSLTHPHGDMDSNMTGFLNMLERARHASTLKHLVYASSSSVYGANTQLPFSVHHNVDHPVSLYAASKKANELMAHCYSHLYNIPTTGLRFFTVYGPWGRPDMALFKFTKAILKGEPIDVYNHGKMERDFTYIDDIVEGIVRLLMKPAEAAKDWDGNQPDPATSQAPYRVYNIGNNQPARLMDMIAILEKTLGKTATKNLLPIQDGDVPSTHADIDALQEAVGFSPATSLETGIKRFVDWYMDYYGGAKGAAA